MKIDLNKTLVVTFVYGRDMRISVWNWLELNVPDRTRRFSIAKSPYIAARNTAIRDIVLPRRNEFEFFLSIDNDVDIDASRMHEFLAIDADFVACDCETGNQRAFEDDDAFHSPMWWCRTDALAQIKSPWFLFPYTEDGCDLAGCDCSYFRKKAIDAGFSVKHGGWCVHHRTRSWGGSV